MRLRLQISSNKRMNNPLRSSSVSKDQSKGEPKKQQAGAYRATFFTEKKPH